jgi:nitroreductase
MKNPAPVDHPIADLLVQRWSPRAFADRPVDAAVLRQLFEAARWAASCFGDQPWHYLVATREKPEEFQKMLACLVEPNQMWAKNSPVLAISVARATRAKDGSPNVHAWHDVGAASALLSIEATDLGLFVHQMGGFDPHRARETYGIPAGYDAVAAMAIGYPGDPASLPEHLRTRESAPRTRKALSEFVFSGNWGATAPFVKAGPK